MVDAVAYGVPCIVTACAPLVEGGDDITCGIV